ncbi:hypothetical protein G6F50_015449 [Rhizopus delemar]|uniref:Prephenate/arogenate dehydrogenase domain-containing protein n=1 Tax=Rhizopus delemar TaxID=936053 RepID=A0A9P6XYA6_9FUNG|nr:hypothetical protein G6F50_015449 [Rhizopus delemar]
MLPHLGATTVLTDAGSTKAEVGDAAREALAGSIGRFVPGHPIAGAERTGPDAADPGLYQGRTVILTPLAENSAQATDLPSAASVVRGLYGAGGHGRRRAYAPGPGRQRFS